MMDGLRTWIVGISAVSILLAAAQCLMPEGSIRKIGRLAGGLLLLMAVLTPLKTLDVSKLSFALTEYRLAGSGHTELLELENERLVKMIIEEQTAAYILDKAEELGAACAVEVEYAYTEEGAAYPTAVTVVGALTEEQEETLAAFIERELAVPREQQQYERGEGS